MTKKISQLPAATSVDTNDEFVINQDGTTKKLTTANEWQFSDVNIDGGNIDGTAIGASSASSGAFTTLNASGDVNFDSGTLFVDASTNTVGMGITPSDIRFDGATSLELSQVKSILIPRYTMPRKTLRNGSDRFLRLRAKAKKRLTRLSLEILLQ